MNDHKPIAPECLMSQAEELSRRQSNEQSSLAATAGWASEVAAMAKRLVEIEEAVARQNVGTHIWTNIHIGRLHIQDAGQSLGKMPNGELRHGGENQ